MKRFFFLVTLCFFGQGLISQNILGVLTNASSLGQISTEANLGLNIRFDYLTTLQTFKLKSEPVMVGGGWNVPFFSQENGADTDLFLTSAFNWKLKNKFQMPTGLRLGAHFSEDISARYFNYGLRIDLFPGRAGERWFFGGHFSFDYRPFVFIKHKEWSKRAFENLYPDGEGKFTAPENGWFTQHMRFGNYGVAIAYNRPQWGFNFLLDYQCPLTPLGFKIIPEIGMFPFSAMVGYVYLLGK